MVENPGIERVTVLLLLVGHSLVVYWLVQMRWERIDDCYILIAVVLDFDSIMIFLACFWLDFGCAD